MLRYVLVIKGFVRAGVHVIVMFSNIKNKIGKSNASSSFLIAPTFT